MARGSQAAAPGLERAPRGMAYVTWGSQNLAGGACWGGAVERAEFDGELVGMTVVPEALDEAQIRALAREVP